MRAPETASRLAGFEGRGAGTDAERRAARWLADQLAAGGRAVGAEPFWCRPSWALAHAWHLALAAAGSLVAVTLPPLGTALLVAALASVLADELTGSSPGRRLTPESASQNVVAAPPPRRAAQEDGGGRAAEEDAARIRLIITANYDAGRLGLAYRDESRAAAARARRLVRGLTPGWLGWAVIAIVWLLAIAILRLRDDRSHLLGAIQLPPTVGLVLGLAALLDIATGDWSPAAGDNATGVAVALELARALDAGPPRNLDVEVVLAGAGDGGGVGLRRYLRSRRRERTAANTIVLGIAPCGAGSPRWWVSDGALLPLRYARPLRRLAAQLPADATARRAAPHHGRGATPAFTARTRGLPAIAIGCLDERGLVPRSHQREDTPANLDPAAIDAALALGLIVIDAIDAAVPVRERRQTATRA